MGDSALTPRPPIAELLANASSEYLMYAACFRDEIAALRELHAEAEQAVAAIVSQGLDHTALECLQEKLERRQAEIDKRLKSACKGICRTGQKLQDSVDRLGQRPI